MRSKKLAVDTINKKMYDYEKYADYKDKADLDRATLLITEQIKLVHELNLINTIIANKYLSDLQKIFTMKLQRKQFKEFREQVINFNDDFTTEKEQLFIIRKTENNNLKMSMNEWKNAIDEEKKGIDDDTETSKEEPVKDVKQINVETVQE